MAIREALEELPQACVRGHSPVPAPTTQAFGAKTFFCISAIGRRHLRHPAFMGDAEADIAVPELARSARLKVKSAGKR